MACAEASSRTLQRNALIGLVASVGLAAVKFVAGVLGHSSALVADAVESLADSVGSIIVWQGLRVARREPDEEHPYGYGKAEALAALSVGVLLLAAAGIIVSKALSELVTPHNAPAWWTLLVLVAVVAVKETMFRFLMSSADEFRSDAARADAWHHRSDAITSAAALVGVAIAVWGPGMFAMPRLVLADEVAALLASAIIVVTALRLMRPSLRELLDGTDHELVALVRATAAEVEGVRLIEKVYVRKSGSLYHVDMHLHVDPLLSVENGHALAGRVKARLREQIANVQHVLIHIEPACDESPGER
ncbi:MAG: cation diffusion facilitator family transporter [Phycisphaerae bacterium]|nr:cation diffusion facilitator family transporter [Phycisphaerae bacterium]